MSDTHEHGHDGQQEQDTRHGHDGHHGQGHGNGHVHLDEADWAAYAAHTAVQGEVFMSFLTDTVVWVDELRGARAPEVRRVLDVGSGPGVASCELAVTYPAARVTAVDSSPAMLEMAAARAARLGLADRVDTRLAELPGGVDGLVDADVIWASMSLHHVGDEVAALRVLRALLSPTGVLAIAEIADPTEVLPDDLGVGRPGFGARLRAAGASWFADMRRDLEGSVESADLATMLAAAGFEVIGERVVRGRLDPPLADDAREVAHGELLRGRSQFGDRLDDDDRATLDALCDEADARSALRRPDLFMASARQIVIARPTAG